MQMSTPQDATLEYATTLAIKWGKHKHLNF